MVIRMKSKQGVVSTTPCPTRVKRISRVDPNDLIKNHRRKINKKTA
jgi:hypothetical protein